MSTNALARISSTPAAPVVQHDAVALGTVLAQSGYFQDARQAAQAAVKVLAGQELGLGPIAAMTGIYIVQGRVTIGANLIAAMVRRHPRYDYRIVEHTDQVCRIAFYDGGQAVGESSFSMDDAKRAALVKAGGPWTAHPRNMLFARAMSNGSRWHCPDVFAGAPVYTPEELGAQVNPETGEVIVSPPPAPAPATSAAEDVSLPSTEQVERLGNLLAALADADPGVDWTKRLDEWVAAKFPGADGKLSRVETDMVIEAMDHALVGIVGGGS